VQYHLANRNVDAAMAECDKQRGSVANVMRAGLRRYKEMTTVNDLGTDQKVLAIQKKVEEATALEASYASKKSCVSINDHFRWYPGCPAWYGNGNDPFFLCVRSW
jgi:hypothetical protein